jgi:hypothetical protein
MQMRALVLACAATLGLIIGLADVAAGGGLADEHGDDGATVFFGYVKDTRGVGIADARVSVTFKNMSFITMTDVIGAYRISTTTDPDLTEVSCSKQGYRQTGAMRRPMSGAAKTPVEIDCTLQRSE